MTVPAEKSDVLDIHFRDIDRSDAVEAVVREKAAKLLAHADPTTSCRVVLCRPKARGHRGHLYKVRIELGVAGAVAMVVDRDPGLDHAHEDVYVAIRDAFAAAERRLEGREQRSHDSIKHSFS